ncbi:hypothetical protein SAMN05443428_11376 [Caloramator quimbayensis]|uniref:Uncharacterized protein n=1 Tax=Caloramator quimbayensis TaxID=1147123 RepID=A0A1T4XVZ1_9CLOT|nr:hypothetical protein [Caloramator quimbayensis]SKA93245.1 hypothetical protein SAMN05443428_11376 [Caloramator quimbayensis]
MLSINNVDTVYLACGITDLRKSIDKLALLFKGSLSLILLKKHYWKSSEQLNKIEKELKEKYQGSNDFYKKPYEVRLEKSAAIIEEFIMYVDIELKNALHRSSLGQALEYS